MQLDTAKTIKIQLLEIIISHILMSFAILL